MTLEEFSNQFDLLFNNVTSNQAPGLNEWEKSVFLTKAEKEIVKNHFTATSKGNNIGQGFDDSALRQADFSMLMKTSTCDIASPETESTYRFLYESGDNTYYLYDTNITLYNTSGETVGWTTLPLNTRTAVNTLVIESITYSVITLSGTNYIIQGLPNAVGYITRETYTPTGTFTRVDQRSAVYEFPSDVFIVINETITSSLGKYLQVVPLRYDEYLRLMSKPFKRPVKNQAWRLINTGSGSAKYVEVIVGYQDSVSQYYIRYIRTPKPIILSPLDGLSIDGYYGTDSSGDLVTETASDAVSGIECELDPILHEDILQRAVELAKVAWTANGQENVQLVMQAGQRSE